LRYGTTLKIRIQEPVHIFNLLWA